MNIRKRNSKMNDGQLISVVARYEELYNTNHSQYSNQQRRDSIWEEIGLIMRYDGSVCKERWTRIRDNFRKALNLRRIKNAKSAFPIKAPKFLKELSFLLPYMTDDEPRRPGRSGSDTEDDSVLASIQNNIRLERPSSPSPVTITCTPGYSPDMEIPNTSFNYTNRETIGIPNVSAQVNAASYAAYRNNFDPLTEFFIAMANTVKTFPIHEQLKMKADVFQIINDAELRLATAAEPVPSVTQSTISDITSPERSSRRAVKRERSYSDNDN